MEFLTYDDYKTYANLKQPDIAPDVKVLIDAANAHVSAWLNITEDASETIQVLSTRNTYFLSGISANSISYIRPMTATDDTYDLDPSTYFLKPPGTLTFIVIPPAGYYNVALDFATSDPTTVTQDIKNAVYMLVNYWAKSEYRDSRSFGGETVAFTTQATGMPKHIRTILELYRNI